MMAYSVDYESMVRRVFALRSLKRDPTALDEDYMANIDLQYSTNIKRLESTNFTDCFAKKSLREQ
jgi:hypothetical protein